MIDGKRVVAWTPWGRRRTAEILARYMLRDHEAGVVDEWWVCRNVSPGQDDDLAYAADLAERHSWVRPVDFPEGWVRRTPIQLNTGSFYRHMTDPDTVYIRLDDDLVYLHESAVERLVRAKLAASRSMCCFAMIINNAVCSHFGQAMGVIPREWGVVGNYCMDGRGWADGGFATKLHHLLLDHVEAGTPEKMFLYTDVALPIGQQFSVSCFASSGADYAALPDGPGVLPGEEEAWHSVHRPLATGAPNMIIGDALVSHYSFGPQASFLWSEKGRSDVLERYRALAEALPAP